jgi:hypothetical protein
MKQELLDHLGSVLGSLPPTEIVDEWMSGLDESIAGYDMFFDRVA